MVRFIARAFVLVALMSVICCVQAQAWEFALSSSTSLSYLYFSQMGDNGFFGRHDVSTDIDAAVANGWLGNSLGIVSGADGSISSTSTSFFPSFWPNQAFFLTGVYRISNVETGSFPGSGRSFATGEWLSWLVTMETPWGIASFGKKPFGFGMGLQYDSTARSEEHLTLVSDMGPLQFGLGVYPSRTPIELNPNLTSSGVGFNQYWNLYDKSGHLIWDIFAFVNYENGPIGIGAGFLFNDQHMGPEGTPTNAGRINIPTVDLTSNEGWIYVRYNAHSIFVQAEADWHYRKVRFQRSRSGSFQGPGLAAIAENVDGSGSIFRPQYTESWRYAIEAGFLSGPLRVAFLYAFVPGPDRRHGVLIDRQPVIVNPYLPNFDEVIYHPDHGNASLTRPYSALLVNAFGSGVGAYGSSVGAFNRSGEGYLVDASALAVRLDYAIAANLNVYGSFLHATRVSHGYGWGFIRPVLLTGPNVFAVRSDRIRNFTAPSPAIPDNDLGWEVGMGLDWQLFESMVMGFTAAYWKPGRWFNYACVDRSVAGWELGPVAAPWAVNPNRSIDGIFGLNLSLAVNF